MAKGSQLLIIFTGHETWQIFLTHSEIFFFLTICKFIEKIHNIILWSPSMQAKGDMPKDNRK